MAIPASDIVEVTPGVLAAAGSAIDLNGLILTQNQDAPYCTVMQFTDAAGVKDFFGAVSDEGQLATIYFNGYQNSYRRPGLLYITRYNNAMTAAYLRGGRLRLSLEALQKVKGPISINIDSNDVSVNVDFSAVASFSEAAERLTEALDGKAIAEFMPVSPSFKITSATSGAKSNVGFGEGDVAESLSLTEDKGAFRSLGSDADTPEAFMDDLVKLTMNWALFTTVWRCTPDELMAFSAWASNSKDRYGFVGWDTNPDAKKQGEQEGVWGDAVKARDFTGVIPFFGTASHAVLVLSYAASLDFNRANGRTVLAFRSQAGMPVTVKDATEAHILLSRGYSFYGNYATSKENFNFIYDGKCSGRWRWTDTFVNQIWLNATIQRVMIQLLINTNSIPYNDRGYSLINAALLDPLESAITFGAIRAGVTLSSGQRSEIEEAVGRDISTSLFAKGYYVLVEDAAAAVRVERQSPAITVYYTDGGSVQRLKIASIAIL